MRPARLALLACLSTASPRLAAAAGPPLRVLTSSERLTFTEGGALQTYFEVAPGRPLKLATQGPMLLLIPARVMTPGGAASPASPVDVTVNLDVGGAPRIFRERLTETSAIVKLSDGSMAGPAKVLRIPIEPESSTVSVEASSPIAVGFARTALPATPVSATGPSPAAAGLSSAPAPPPVPTTMPLAPLIRRRVERLSLGARGDVLFPSGAVDARYGDGMTNLYVGGEIRYSLPVAERRFSIGAEAGSYQLKDVAPIALPSGPVASQSSTDVVVTTRVTPIFGNLSYKAKLSERRAVFLEAGAGAVLVNRTEAVYFNATQSYSDTRGGGVARLGYEQKLGGGRLVLEGGYLHVLKGPDPNHDSYLGGGMGGLQYRFIF